MVQKLWLGNTENVMLFDACDIDLDPMTLILKLDLDMMVTYLQTKSEVNGSKGMAKQTHEQTHRQTDRRRHK